MDENNTLHPRLRGPRLRGPDLGEPALTGRPTIGLFTYGLMDTIGQAVWLGIDDAAREHDVNLICYEGGTLRDFTGVSTPANVLYNLTDFEQLDGLVIWSGLLHHVDPETAEDFYYHYASLLPTVSLGVHVVGIPSVLVDNYTGMYSAVEHLVTVHGYRRIAFVRGPEGLDEAGDRYRAYLDVLKAYDIEVDLSLVVPGTNQRSSGIEAINLLCDERHLRPHDDFEAVIAANDNMAFGVLDALQARGVSVPDEMAVVGFDDFEEGRHTSPPLTTVPWPGYALGHQAAELLIALLDQTSVPELTRVPTELIVRESCGCVIPAVQQAGVAVASPAASEEALLEEITAERDAALEELRQAVQDVGTQSAMLDDTALAELWNLFVSALDPASNGDCLRGLLALVRRTADAGVNVNVWHTTLSLLRRRALAHALSYTTHAHLDSFCHQARVMISYEVQRTLA
ncbi:MAG: substrate-binding domain-containing protein, partial [Anaerolineae bacterium]|nr:substrate-binding domain-containing protein [Anaerolineae bacterium]